MIVQLTLLMILACLGGLALRRASAAARHLVWSAALGVSLLLPFAKWMAPVGTPSQLLSQSAGALMRTTARLPGGGAGWGSRWVLAIYTLVSGILLLRLLRDVLAANRLVKEARPEAWSRVRVSFAARVPFAWGAIVVPAEFAMWPEEDRAAVIAHEAAHLARHDRWTGILARVACAVYWFHPLVWLAAARLRLEADRACDDAVLRSGHASRSYAGALVAMARTLQDVPLAPAAVRASELEMRVRHILSGRVNRRQMGKATAIALLAACLGAAYPLVALSQENEPGVYKVGSGVSAPRVLSKVDPDYTEEARAAKISGSVLVSVIVGKDGTARNCKVVRSLDPGLDASAITAIQQWKFVPGVRGGEAVDVRASIEVNFRLE